MTTLALVTAIQFASTFGAVLLFGIGCICVGVMLIFALFTFIAARHRFNDRHGGTTIVQDDGALAVGIILCVITFIGALAFFVLAVRLGVT